MSSTKENRLTFVTLEELNKQRAAAGASPEVAPYNTRTAQANATVQDQQRAYQLSLNNPNAPQGYTPSNVQTFTGGINRLNEAKQTYGNQAAGSNTVYDQSTGLLRPTNVIPTGQLGDVEQRRQKALSDLAGTGYSGFSSPQEAISRTNASFDAEAAQQKNQPPAPQKKETTPSTDQQPQGNPALLSALGSLAPEEQAVLGPLIQQIQSTTEKGITDSAARTKALLQGGIVDGAQVPGLIPTFQGLQQQIEDMKTERKSAAEAIQGIAKDIRDDNQKYLDQQQQTLQERSWWEQHQQERTLEQQKNKVHQSLVAQFALDGGFGQDALLREVRGSDADFEQKIQAVQTEFGIQRTDLVTKFTGMYLENNNAYRDKSMKNVEDLVSALENLDAQGQTNTKSYLSAQQGLLKDMWDTETGLRKDLAASNLSIGKEMLGMIEQKKKDERQDSQDAMSSLLTLRGQGVTNLSGNQLKAIQDKLPGIDVNAVLKDPTSASIKAAAKAAVDYSTSAESFKDPEQASIMDGANLAANGMSVTAGEGFRSEVARKLRDGDTQGARSYMYTQIANNLKGPALTEYDSRANQTIQIKSILDQMQAHPEFKYDSVEYYKQKALAIMGKASPEYYAIMAPIAQLSAEITHGLSGAAVSPSEWSRLQKFLPDTGEGKDVLEVKLKSLLKFATWMNEAKVARAANLPVPGDPTLTPAEQKAQQNVPKEDYVPSNESINDALHPAHGSPLSYVNNFRLTQDYGSLEDQRLGLMNGPHYALDLAPKVRGTLTSVPALRGGTVVSVTRGGPLGNSVVIEDESGNQYIYGHLASLAVNKGDTVDADTYLGIMGNTGATDGGVHLHLAVKDRNGKYVDPRAYIS